MQITSTEDSAFCIRQITGCAGIRDHGTGDTQVKRGSRCRADAHMRHETGDDQRIASQTAKHLFQIGTGKRVRQALIDKRFVSGRRNLRCDQEIVGVRVEDTARRPLMLNMDDRPPCRSCLGNQLAALFQCRRDAVARHAARHIFELRINHRHGAVHKFIRVWVGARHLSERLRHVCSPNSV